MFREARLTSQIVGFKITWYLKLFPQIYSEKNRYGSHLGLVFFVLLIYSDRYMEINMHNPLPATFASNPNISPHPSRVYTFIDLFAGCGGLSLGLFRAGWSGLFGVEKDSFAFETLSANFLGENSKFKFNWPSWLPKEPTNLSDLLSAYRSELAAISTTLDLLVGGPPCQGFSSAGRRDPHDPRNRLLSIYLEAVEILRPRFILIENVKGITVSFSERDNPLETVNYSTELLLALSGEYKVWSEMLDSSDFGVPQSRKRFFVLAQRKDIEIDWDPFMEIAANRQSFLRRKGLHAKTRSQSALSDLELTRNGSITSQDTLGFEEIAYKHPLTHYQKLMRDGATTPPSCTRLARHRPDIADRFSKIIELCHKDGHLNSSLRKAERDRFGLLKKATRVLDPDQPAPTITSMPDDLLHYSEPRTLTVRENARLQSFPDWFVFKGKYTTGGHLRRKEVPRFTQVANAVPPLMVEAIGETILEHAKLVTTEKKDLYSFFANESNRLLKVSL